MIKLTLLILAFVTLFSAVVLADDVVLSVQPPSNTGNVGTTFIINISLVNVQSLAAYDIILKYDPSVLNATSIDFGGNIFAANGVRTIDAAKKINNTAGEIRIAQSMLGDNPVSGNGYLAKITFNISKIGKSSLDITRDNPEGDSSLSYGLINRDFARIVHTTQDGSFDNSPPGQPSQPPQQTSGGGGGGGGGTAPTNRTVTPNITTAEETPQENPQPQQTPSEILPSSASEASPPTGFAINSLVNNPYVVLGVIIVAFVVGIVFYFLRKR